MTYLELGRRGRGKTTLAYYMAAKIKRRVILDPRGMIRRPGALVVRTIESFERAMDALGDGDVSEVVYWPSDSIRQVAFPTFTREVKAWILARPHTALAILIDELSFVCAGNTLDEDFEWILKTSDREQVQIFLTCHRPADVPVDIRAIADYWCIFHTTQEHDLDVIRGRCRADTADLVANLRGAEFVMWNDGDATLRQYRDPSAWYIPLKEGQVTEWDG